MAFPKKRLDRASKAQTNGGSNTRDSFHRNGGCAKLNGESAFTTTDIENLRKKTIEYCRTHLGMTDVEAEQFAEIFDSSLQETEAEFQTR